MNAYVITDLVKNSDSPELLPGLLTKIDNEVNWMDDITHKGGKLPRKFTYQCELNENGDKALYRHPMDHAPLPMEFSTIVCKIKNVIEKRLGVSFNHVIIQGYQDGSDHVTEHSDKTMDVEPGSLIVNYSIGESRVMRFRSKELVRNNRYEIIDLVLPNDSLCVLDLETNRYYKHSIKQNKEITKARISLTFRKIATFYNEKNGTIYGQGAPKEGIIPLSKEELCDAWYYENRSIATNLYDRGYDKLGLN